jgi:hypothetical protein
MFNLYVWEGVLAGYTGGMAVAIGRTKDEAIATFDRLTSSEVRELQTETPEVIPLRARGMTPKGWYLYGGD